MGCDRGIEKWSEYITMSSDGTMIAVDVFLPGTDYTPPYPTVFAYTPYQRAQVGLFNQIKDAYDSVEIVPFLLSNGFAYVVADMRGSGASFGWKMDFMPAIADDGKEIVDWIAAQSWCDGNVGMIGRSYTGWAQLAVASRAPTALKCIFPIITPFDAFSTALYPGGIFSYAFVQLFGAGAYTMDRNWNIPLPLPGGWKVRPTAPAFDEDGDGDYADEVPIYKNLSGTLADALSFVFDYSWPDTSFDPPQYSDGASRGDHFLFDATMDHVAGWWGAPGNYDIMEYGKEAYYINAQLPFDNNLTIYDLSTNLIPKVMDSGIPIYNMGAWFGGFCRGTFKLYATMKDTNRSKLMVMPNYHVGMSQGFADYLGVNPDDFYWYSDTGKQEVLRWFERWLKGVPNGIENEPPIEIYVMNGEGWREENEWPLARQVMTKLYFGEDGRLDDEETENGTDTYVTDYTHNAGFEEVDVSLIFSTLDRETVNDKFYRSRYTSHAFQTPSQLPLRTGKDEKCLTYTSDPMRVDREVTGHPIVRLWVSSTAAYGDLFLYLEDVDEDGNAVLITESPLRIGFAGLVDDDEQINPNPGVDVLPDLPWHGFEDTDYVDGILGGGNIVEIVNDFHPTSWVFRQGHRIRISIACADWPNFRLNPHLYAGAGDPTNVPGDYLAPTITVYRGSGHPSHIELPIIP